MIKQKAVFFDRDGVLNNEESNYYIFRTGDFFLNPGIIETLKILRDRGYIFIVITNQGGISKNLYTHKDVTAIHDLMTLQLKNSGIDLAEIYYCPHHSDNEKCLCRKPGYINIQKAISRFNIDPLRSWFVGDRETDMEAGRKAGLKTLLVKANSNMSFLTDIIP